MYISGIGCCSVQCHNYDAPVTAQLRVLDLSYNPLTAIPMETGNLELLKELGEWDIGIGQLQLLEWLDVSHCNIAEWPLQLDGLSTLQHLNLSHNKLKSVPPTLVNMTGLEVFNVSHNRIENVPSDLYELKALRELHLNNNALTDLPHCSDPPLMVLPAVKHLDISYNNIKVFDDRVGQFPNAETILAQHNCIKSLGAALDSLSQLKYFDLSHNELTELTPAGEHFGGCVSLTYLDVSHNALESMPPTMIKCTGLVKMDWSFNQLKELLGKAFAMMPHVTYLDLQINHVVEIPSTLYTMRKISYLDIGHNEVDGPISPNVQQLNELTYLNLSHNHITSIPASISELKKLTVLELKGNELTELPETVSKLYKLNRITLSRNKFKVTPNLLATMPHLLAVNLSGNNIAGNNVNWKEVLSKYEKTHESAFPSVEMMKLKVASVVAGVDAMKDAMVPCRVKIENLYNTGGCSGGGEDVAEDNQEIADHAAGGAATSATAATAATPAAASTSKKVTAAERSEAKKAAARAAKVARIRALKLERLQQSRRAVLDWHIKLRGYVKGLIQGLQTEHVRHESQKMLSLESAKSLNKKSFAKLLEKEARAEESDYESSDEDGDGNDDSSTLSSEVSSVNDRVAKHRNAKLTVEKQQQLQEGNASIQMWLAMKRYEVSGAIPTVQQLGEITSFVLAGTVTRPVLEPKQKLTIHGKAPVLAGAHSDVAAQEMARYAPMFESIDLGLESQTHIEAAMGLVHEVYVLHVRNKIRYLHKLDQYSETIAAQQLQELEDLTSDGGLSRAGSRKGPMLSRGNSMKSGGGEGLSRGNSVKAALTKARSIKGGALSRAPSTKGMLSRAASSRGAAGGGGIGAPGQLERSASLKKLDKRKEAIMLSLADIVTGCNIADTPATLIDKRKLAMNKGFPYLYDHSRFLSGDPEDPLTQVMFDAYMVLVKALLCRAQALRDAIRVVEVRGSVPHSILDIAQRDGEDFIDTMGDVYQGLLEEVAAQEEKEKRMTLLQMNKSVPSDLGAQLGTDNESGNDEGEDDEEDSTMGSGGKLSKLSSLVSDQSSKGSKLSAAAASGGDADADLPVGSGAAAVASLSTKSGSKPGTPARSKRNADSSSSSAAGCGPPQHPPTKLVDLLQPYDLREWGKTLADPPIETQAAVDAAKYLQQHRLLLLLWANRWLEAAADIVRMHGWSLRWPEYKIHSANRYNGPIWLSDGTKMLHILQAQVYQGLGMYPDCLKEYGCFFRLCKGVQVKHMKEQVIKVLIAQGDYNTAQDSMKDLLTMVFDHAKRENWILPTEPVKGATWVPLEIVRLDKMAGLLFALLERNLELVRNAGTCSTAQYRLFAVQMNGLLTRPPHIPTEIQNGVPLDRARKVAEMRKRQETDHAAVAKQEDQREYQAFIAANKRRMAEALQIARDTLHPPVEEKEEAAPVDETAAGTEDVE